MSRGTPERGPLRRRGVRAGATASWPSNEYDSMTPTILSYPCPSATGVEPSLALLTSTMRAGHRGACIPDQFIERSNIRHNAEVDVYPRSAKRR